MEKDYFRRNYQLEVGQCPLCGKVFQPKERLTVEMEGSPICMKCIHADKDE
jgi:hypothetical protein